jgi:hypothetical protein
MIQLRELRLTGPSKPPAAMKFVAGGNVISGASDTGKSYLFRCMDFVLGAEKMGKKVDEDEGYDTALLEFCNDKGSFLTLSRHLTGGDINIHYTTIDAIDGKGDTVAWKRKGKSAAPDVTSVLFSFAGIEEAMLRANSKGRTVRLTVRTLFPVFLVNETSIIAENSPIYGDGGFDQTARKRMFSYVLTGLDDTEVASVEQTEMAQAAARAKLVLLNELLVPVEQRLSISQFEDGQTELTIDRADEAIGRLSNSLAENRQERERLQADRNDATVRLQSASAQVIAVDQLLQRYDLLDKRYSSDLQRLDFIAEGSHFLGQLQEARCPLCDQPMNAEHRQHLDGHADSKFVYESSKAEAAKILGLRSDLIETISSLKKRREAREREQEAARIVLKEIDARIDRELAPALSRTKEKLDQLIARRLELETIKSDNEQAEVLRTLRAGLESSLEKPSSAAKEWAGIDPILVRKLCTEIEAVLEEWAWPGEGRVEFDENNVDINVDGKPRQSHGKGVRAILHTAFVIGLLRYCVSHNRPHPGFVVLDSPLTTYKQGQVAASGDLLDPTIEHNFWTSLVSVPKNMQIVVIDNKEPPPSVSNSLAYTYFAGPNAKPAERRGFIPS